MNEQAEQISMMYEHQPYLVRVIATENVKVSFSPFMVTEELYNQIQRGIADINVAGGEADIHVFVKDNENVLLKLNEDETGWKELSTEIIGPPRGDWKGYIKATFKPGDPPIAVG